MQPSTPARDFFKVPGRELEDLLYPHTPQRFLDEYWARKALYVKGSPDKFSGLFSRAAFHGAAKQAGALHVEFKDGTRLRKPHAEDVDVLFRQGATVCLTDIGHAHPPLQAVVDAIKSQLGFSGILDVRSYLSNDGCGYSTHADARIATTLQISGRKLWRFSQRPCMEFPLRNVVSGPDGFHVRRFGHDELVHRWERFDAPDEQSFSEVVLEPGDLLCLPAGVWHSAQAIGHSLAINLAFNTPSFDQLILSALRERLLANPQWRRPIPLLTGAAPDGTVPHHVAAFFAERLREMKAYIDELAPDGHELAHAWRASVYSRSRAVVDTVPGASHCIGPGDRFLRAAFAGFGWSANEALEPALTVYVGARNRSVRLPNEMEPFVRKLMAVDAFQADECRNWAGEGSRYEWPAVEAALRSLLDSGLLERESAA